MAIQGYSSGISDQLYRNYDDQGPQNIKEWTEQHIELVKQIKNIDSQLANKNVLADDGKRLSGKAYFQRRQKLIEAKNGIDQKLLDLKANTDKSARGTILESTLDKSLGNIATNLNESGTLNI